MINIYTKNNCMPCKMTKNWLRNHGLTYNEINVDENLAAIEYLISINCRTMPVVFKDDELVAMGFQPQNLNQLKGGK